MILFSLSSMDRGSGSTGKTTGPDQKVWAKGASQACYPKPFREDDAWGSPSALSQTSPSVWQAHDFFACQTLWLSHPQTPLPQASACFSCASGQPCAWKSSHNVWWASLIVELQKLIRRSLYVVMPGAHPTHHFNKERREDWNKDVPGDIPTTFVICRTVGGTLFRVSITEYLKCWKVFYYSQINNPVLISPNLKLQWQCHHFSKPCLIYKQQFWVIYTLRNSDSLFSGGLRNTVITLIMKI